MATNGNKSFYVTDYDKLVFEWAQKSQDISSNSTTISWSLKLVASNYGKIIASGTSPFSVTVNSKKQSQNCSIAINNNETRTLMSGTETIKHNDDGTASFNFEVSGTFNMNFANSYVGTIKGSGTGTLNKINRVSTLNKINDFELDKEIVISYNKYISSYVNTLVIKAKNTTIKTISNVQNNQKIKFDEVELINIYKQYPNSTVCGLDFYLNTSDSTNNYVGQSVQIVNATIPKTEVPIIFNIQKIEGGDGNPFSEYVQGISKLNIVVSGSASTGATLTMTKIKVDGIVYNGYNITTNILENSGTIPIEVELIDSRGRTTKQTETIFIEGYEKPKINYFYVRRCDETQQISNVGKCVLVNIDCEVSSINSKNAFDIVINYKKVEETNYNSIQVPIAHPRTKTTVFIDEIDVDYSYNFEIKISDTFNSVSKAMVVPTAFTLIDFLNGGKGLAFGKVADTENAIDFNLQALIRKNLVLENATTIYSKQNNDKLVNLLGLSKSNNAFIGAFSAENSFDGDLNLYSGRTINFYGNRVDGTSDCALAFGNDGNSTSLRTEIDGKIYLGSATNRFNTAYFVNQIIASDLKEKEEVELNNFNAKEFIMSLKPRTYRRTSDFDRGVRTHLGFYAQEIDELIKSRNYGDLALVQATKKDGSSYFGEAEDDESLVWGINYIELIAPIIQTIQEQQKEIEELKKLIKEV